MRKRLCWRDCNLRRCEEDRAREREFIAGRTASVHERSEGALLPALASLALVLLPPCARAEAQEPVAAVWKERELHF